jgi:cytochrome c-type biogenesis protein CcmH/NrfG
MKYIEGETLKTHMAGGKLSQLEKMRIIEAIGAALTYAHRQGILHRDIKPSNVIIAKDGQVYLADFGLARIASAGESTLSSDMFIGTPQYISPEQAQGKRDLDEGTDIYSLGVLLYEMTVGRVPFSADTPYAIIHDHIFTPLPLPRTLNPSLTEDLERVLLKALAKNRADRFTDIASMVDAFRLTALGEGGTKPVQESSRTVQTPAEVVKPIHPEPVSPLNQTTAAPGFSAEATQVSPTSDEAAPSVTNTDSVEKPKKKTPWYRRWYFIFGLLLFLCLCLLAVASRIGENQKAAQTQTAQVVQSGEQPAEGLPSQGETPLPTPDPIALAEKRVAETPDDPRAHFDLALALFNADRRQRAEEEYNTALSLAGDDLDFYQEAAALMSEREAWLPTAQMYLILAQKHPKPFPVDLVEKMHEAWYKASALAEFPGVVPFEELLEVDLIMGGVANARYAINHLTIARARVILTPIVERSPDLLEARLVLAELQMKNNNPAEAQQTLQEILSRSNPPAWVVEQANFLLEQIKP